jgi:hypothetical protein
LLNIGMKESWSGVFYIDDVHLYSTTCETTPTWRNCTDKAGNIFPDGACCLPACLLACLPAWLPGAAATPRGPTILACLPTFSKPT